MNEIWKKISFGKGDYEISNLGNIRKNGYLLKGQMNGKYKEIILSNGSSKKKFKVHRLVAEYFLSNPNNYPVVNHKDENPSNNAVSNLEWCTQKYNTNYGTCIRRRSKKHEKAVCQFKDGYFVKKWNSISNASECLGIDSSSITKVAKGMRKTAGGFNWKYDT